MSDTPRTDARKFALEGAGPGGVVVHADFAGELERENAALRDSLQWVKSDIGNYGEVTSSTMDLIDAALAANPPTSDRGEIERLREALTRTLSWLTSYPGGGAMGVYEQARAALGDPVPSPTNCGGQPATAEAFRSWLVDAIEDRAADFHERACPMYAQEARAIAAFIRTVEIDGVKPRTARCTSALALHPCPDCGREMIRIGRDRGGEEFTCAVCALEQHRQQGKPGGTV